MSLSDVEVLSDEQKAVIEHPGEVPILVQSGAGSGKTLVLTRRIHHLLINEGVQPSQIMAITFTRKAALEMKERLSAMPGILDMYLKTMLIGTVHACFLRILRSAGLKQEILVSEAEKEWILKGILKESGLQDAYDPESLLMELSLLKNRGVNLFGDIAAKSTAEKEMLQLFRLFEGQKQENNLMDFDDILLMTKMLLEEDEGLLSGLQAQFQHILVDEFQDLNGLQFQVIKMLTGQGYLSGYGDHSQSIYSFRASNPRILLEFRKHYPDAEILQLSTNYRTTAPIQRLADSVLLYNNHSHIQMKTVRQSDKEPILLRPENQADEAKAILKLIKDSSSNSIAVLARTSEYLRPVLEQFVLDDIPCCIASSKCLLYTKPMPKILLDHLRLVVDPYNHEAIAGILPSLYLNRKKTLAELNRIKPAAAITPLEKLMLLPELKDYQKNNIRQRIKLLNTIKDKEPAEAIAILRDGSFDHYVNKSYKFPVNSNKDAVFSKLDNLEESAARFKSPAEFVTFVDKVVAVYEEGQELEDGRVALMTIHSAKGLEFDTVYLVGCIDGLIPHSNSFEPGANNSIFCVPNITDQLAEECRLLYVAITRAKEELYISAPRNYKDKPAELSRFLNGINLKRGDVVTD